MARNFPSVSTKLAVFSHMMDANNHLALVLSHSPDLHSHAVDHLKTAHLLISLATELLYPSSPNGITEAPVPPSTKTHPLGQP